MINLGSLSDLVTTVAVVIGVIFGLAGLRQAMRTRRDHAAVDIVRTVQTQEVGRAVGRILKLPDDADPALIRNDPALLEAALAVDSACEMWGCMVYENVVDHRMLDRMVGGWVPRMSSCRQPRLHSCPACQPRHPALSVATL